MTIRTGFVLATLFLSACAVKPQRPIDFNANALTPSMKVGVVMGTLPPVNTSLPGAACLLCLAAAEIANSALTTHAKSLPYEGLGETDKKVAEALAQRGIDAKVLPRVAIDKLPKAGGIDRAARSFTALGKENGVDKIVVIDLRGIGFLRTYANYFPTSDPKAWISGSSYVVDVATNTLDWYLPLEVQKASTGGWDEAPKFPGLTNAYFQAVEVALDSVLNPLRGPALARDVSPPADAPAAAEPAAPPAPPAPPASPVPAAPAAPAATATAPTT